MSNLSPALVIPDSLLAKEATGILREYSSDLLFNHSVRVYLFAAEQGRQAEAAVRCGAPLHRRGISRSRSEQEVLERKRTLRGRWRKCRASIPQRTQRSRRTGANRLGSHCLAHHAGHHSAHAARSSAAVFRRRPRRARKRGSTSSLRNCANRSSPSTRASISRKPSSRSTSPALRTSLHTTYGTVNAGVCERYIPGFRSPNACRLDCFISLPGFRIAAGAPKEDAAEP